MFRAHYLKKTKKQKTAAFGGVKKEKKKKKDQTHAHNVKKICKTDNEMVVCCFFFLVKKLYRKLKKACNIFLFFKNHPSNLVTRILPLSLKTPDVLRERKKTKQNCKPARIVKATHFQRKACITPLFVCVSLQQKWRSCSVAKGEEGGGWVVSLKRRRRCRR